MTQKEKAKEIVEKYLLEVRGADRYNYNLESMNLFIAKNCAKIHVNGIIESKPHLPNNYLITLKYWYEVLEEIDNL